ncbi:NADH-quinone oxidoreductase subunit J [Halobacteriovorax sp. HLS]|uniref:NADH-quinone oxidoreductase subunit J family protein n=1 Tax=Halobacteriovorax sp. HLS TaxID=2234000 RepID=UPI000FDBE520|nr:NADH-quinone oxidoreductase subunit J [Halobacteriovorax sp. HLS]
MFLDIMFILAALLTLGGAFGVVASKNIMHSCVYLLASLFGVAGLYAILGADFLAATQLIVYAGGVVILMLFAIMLTGGHSQAVNRFGLNKVAPMGTVRTYVIGTLSSLVIGFVILKILASTMKNYLPGELPAFASSVEKVGVLLATDHVLAFEISSVLLLGALVGAAVISRPRKQ